MELNALAHDSHTGTDGGIGRQIFVRQEHAEVLVRPNNPASCLSGCIAINLPPPSLTHVETSREGQTWNPCRPGSRHPCALKNSPTDVLHGELVQALIQKNFSVVTVERILD